MINPHPVDEHLLGKCRGIIRIAGPAATDVKNPVGRVDLRAMKLVAPSEPPVALYRRMRERWRGERAGVEKDRHQNNAIEN